MMTREENICQSCAHSKVCKFNDGESSEYCNQHLALTALRPVRREQVEKVWRGELGEWYFDEFCGEYKDCLKCGASNELPANFCRNCGALLTDEAVQMVMERINEMEGTENGLG